MPNKLWIKIGITILLAVLASLLFGCGEAMQINAFPSAPEIVTDIPYLKMATTLCNDGKCVLQFNRKYVLAPRIGSLTMLHEMCHVKSWDMDFEQGEHGKYWRACMIQLDIKGAFRDIVIDNYYMEKH